MVGIIDTQLKDWRDDIDVIDGRRLVNPYTEFPEFDLYNKAFRLKMFGVCPKCGFGVQSLRDVASRKQSGRCEDFRCDFTFEYYDTALLNSDDPDDIVLDIVRKVLVCGEEEEDPTYRTEG